MRVDAGAFAGTTLIKSYSFIVETRTRDNSVKPVGGEADNFAVTIEGTGNPTAELQDAGDGACVLCACWLWLCSDTVSRNALQARTMCRTRCRLAAATTSTSS